MDLMTLAAVKRFTDRADGTMFVSELNGIKNRVSNIAVFSEDGVIITTNNNSNSNTENDAED